MMFGNHFEYIEILTLNIVLINTIFSVNYIGTLDTSLPKTQYAYWFIYAIELLFVNNIQHKKYTII